MTTDLNPKDTFDKLIKGIAISGHTIIEKDSDQNMIIFESRDTIYQGHRYTLILEEIDGGTSIIHTVTGKQRIAGINAMVNNKRAEKDLINLVNSLFGLPDSATPPKEISEIQKEANTKIKSDQINVRTILIIGLIVFVIGLIIYKTQVLDKQEYAPIEVIVR